MLNFTSHTDNFIQIINVNNEHWVCVSNIFSIENEVFLYDSALYKSIPESLKRNIYFLTNDDIQINLAHVQQQGNGSDCGLFALAFAMSLCLGKDPVQERYAPNLMRRHLFDCVIANKMAEFPQGT